MPNQLLSNLNAKSVFNFSIMGDVLNDAIFEIAEELSESMGLCIPAPDLVKVAGMKYYQYENEGYYTYFFFFQYGCSKK